ncbi:FadR/GntR family transcriptional regulator [Marinoscillum sp. 108]|jgi:GntR family transcriptional regulator, transcriptional repressor for pyruvate dehydrogenase complex|uniref:FadR/GntR family transcriptional regulator n=1 Tax=Marinoscillum luteum TaxID=861051 RepID=A0ABW7NEW4_9BACT|nr:FadR/GntR family transcriptional regulator [Marinoscillum sp. 108]VXD14483.1 GntR family transcriptional repressor for pyruvate dehydrogenase complex [Marinoscillum sp. 108]
MEILSNFSRIKIETPVDKIINQIKELITSGQLKPGDRLPPERKLCEKLGVGRTHLRDAIKKLEFYGILKTLPQSGTVVGGMGITALEGLISDVLKLEANDFRALVETRVLLEVNSAKFAAMRRSDADLIHMSKALSDYEKAVSKGADTVEHDLMFHLKIAEASNNTALKSLMLIISPDILTHFKENNICGGDRPVCALEEHYQIFEHIESRNPELASETMEHHLQDILSFSLEQSGFINGKTKKS